MDTLFRASHGNLIVTEIARNVNGFARGKRTATAARENFYNFKTNSADTKRHLASPHLTAAPICCIIPKKEHADMKELLIIGSGPAGISAALYAVRGGAPLTIVAKDGGALPKAALIQEYYGV